MIRKTLLTITATLLSSVYFTGQLTQGQVSIKDKMPINIQVVVDPTFRTCFNRFF